MENIKLIYKTAHHFKNFIKIEFDDLVQEIAIVYLANISRHDPKRGCLSTFIYSCVKNHLINEKNRLDRFKLDLVELDLANEEQSYYSELYESLTKDEQNAIQFIFDKIDQYNCYPSEKIKNQIAIDLNKEGWKWRKIWMVFRGIKTAIN